jgi:hypothetical protein
LCRHHHDELHATGDEAIFLALHGIDVIQILRQINGGTDDNRGNDEAIGVRFCDGEAW